MANMIPIQTVTVGSGGATSIDFNNIPQIYTDLKIVLSARVSSTLTYSNATIAFNGSSSGYQSRRLTGNGASASSDSLTGLSFMYIGEVNGDTSTSSTFSNLEVYIPNYTSSNNKSVSSDKAQETNATTAYCGMHASLWSNTSPITSISVGQTHYGFLQYSSATLYGIRKY